jgi:hypothetical protein
MRYYYHEKERLNSLFQGIGRLKVPVTIHLRDRNVVNLTPQQMRIIYGIVGTDDKKIKTMFSSKKMVGSTIITIGEKLKQINNNIQTRRKK